MNERRRRGRSPLAAQSKPVPMPVAASLVYHQLNHAVRGYEVDYAAALNGAALALSQVADVYHVHDRKLLRIPSEELIARGVFEDSGATYRAPSGRVYRSLSMRRIDVMQALAVLGKARAAIDKARVKSSH